MLITTIETVITIIVAAAVALELKRDLMMLQQNSYRAERYRRWLDTSRDTTTPARLTAIAVFLISLITFVPSFLAMALMGIEGAAIVAMLATKRYKKPLVFTMRAVRIYAVGLLLTLIAAAIAIAAFRCATVSKGLYTATVALIGVYCLWLLCLFCNDPRSLGIHDIHLGMSDLQSFILCTLASCG